jgi:hypothetical protein
VITTELGDSTLIRRGRSSVTLTEIIAFAKLLEQRPLATLLDELPELARLSDTKFSLAISTLRRRFRGETPADQLQLRVTAHEIAKGIRDHEVAQRIREIFPLDPA